MSEFKKLSDLLDMDMGECIDWVESNAYDNFIVSKGFVEDNEEILAQQEGQITKLTEQNKLLREALVLCMKDDNCDANTIESQYLIVKKALEATK